MATLGISANARMLALAVVKHDTLLDYRIHLFKERWSEAKAARIISRLEACIKAHSITSVAINIPHDHYSTPTTATLLAAIEAHCEQAKLQVSHYGPHALDCFCTPAKAKKKALRRAMTDRYPELYHIHDKELRNKNKYYYKLFEAIAAATLLALEDHLGGFE